MNLPAPVRSPAAGAYSQGSLDKGRTRVFFFMESHSGGAVDTAKGTSDIQSHFFFHVA